VTDRWVNRDAIEWVLYESGAAAEQRFTLLTVGSFTNIEGRGAYPARSLVSILSGRSVRKTERDLAELVKQGHLLPGDRRLVMHIRLDRRPNVYDLPDKYRTWLARGVTLTPHGRATGRQERRHGASGTTERGVTLTPKEFLKNSGKGADTGAQPSAAPDAPPNEQPPPAAPHPYEYGRFGLCARCQLPEPNRAHNAGDP